MNETTAAKMRNLLARVASGEITADYALIIADQLVMGEKILAAAEGGQLTRKLFHLPAAV